MVFQCASYTFLRCSRVQGTHSYDVPVCKVHIFMVFQGASYTFLRCSRVQGTHSYGVPVCKLHILMVFQHASYAFLRCSRVQGTHSYGVPGCKEHILMVFQHASHTFLWCSSAQITHSYGVPACKLRILMVFQHASSTNKGGYWVIFHSETHFQEKGLAKSKSAKQSDLNPCTQYCQQLLFPHCISVCNENSTVSAETYQPCKIFTVINTCANKRLVSYIALNFTAYQCLHIPWGLIFNNSAWLSHYLYGFCMDPRTNSIFFLT